MTESHDLHDVLVRARPTNADLDPTWPDAERDALWSRIQNVAHATRTEPRPAVRRTRRRAAWLAAAATVSAVAVVPVVVNGGDAAARTELLRLAVVASEADGPAIAPGGFLHVRTESVQQNSRLLGDGRRLDTNRDSWVRWDGATWAVDTRPSVGWTEHHRFPAPDEPSFGTPTPEFVAALPDDAVDLRAYLDDTVSGSNSRDEALFVAISDLAGSRLLDAATFAVALEVLAGVDGVETRDTGVDGRDAVAVSFDRFLDIGALSRDTITVDRGTGQLLGVAQSDPGGTYRSRTTLVEPAAGVPEQVRADLQRFGNGSRVCADGREADPGDGSCG